MARQSLESLRRRVERLEETLLADNNLPTLIQIDFIEPGTMAVTETMTIPIDRTRRSLSGLRDYPVKRILPPEDVKPRTCEAQDQSKIEGT